MQEVCGLKWSHCGGQLASGGNDNILCIHDSNFRLQHKINAHQAAVKALAWCPFQVGVDQAAVKALAWCPFQVGVDQAAIKALAWCPCRPKQNRRHYAQLSVHSCV